MGNAVFKKHKWLIITISVLSSVVLILLVVIGVLFAYGCYAFNSLFGTSEIKQGFSPELLDELQTRYAITIPEEAQFIKGYNTGGTDHSVIIFFECPIKDTWESDDRMSMFNYMVQLLKLDSTRYSGVSRDDGVGDDWPEDMDGQMEYMLCDKSISFTKISFNIEAEKLIIRFIGWRPGATFR